MVASRPKQRLCSARSGSHDISDSCSPSAPDEPPSTDGIRRPHPQLRQEPKLPLPKFHCLSISLLLLLLAAPGAHGRQLCFAQDTDSPTCLDFYGIHFDYSEAADSYQKTDNKQLIPLPFDFFKTSVIDYPNILQYKGVPVVKEFSTTEQKEANDAPFISFIGSEISNTEWDKVHTEGYDFEVRFRSNGGSTFGEDCQKPVDGKSISTSSDYEFSNKSQIWGVRLNGQPLVAHEKDLSQTEEGKVANHICICLNNECLRASDDVDFYIEKDSSLKLAYLALITMGLLCLSGIFSGLNLGLMALDPTELKTIKNVGDSDNKRYAEKIEPIRSQGNFLLCTLLLGNTLVNAVLAVFLESIFQGPAAIIFSTLGIVTFGEIIPQSVCSRHGLKVGAQTIVLTKFFMFVTFPLSWPISKLLDYVLGEEIGATIKKRELLELLRQTNEKNNNDLDNEEMAMVQGVLELSTKEVKDVMTRIGDCYMLERGTVLNFKTIAEIMDQGYTRIPVYEDQRTNVTSLLFVRDLAFVDPDDNTPLKIISEFYAHEVKYIEKKQKLDDVLEEFRKNSYHLAIVYDEENDAHTKLPGESNHNAIGIVTLEDIIEELIRGEITDETDKFIDNVDFAINPKRHYKNGAEIYNKLAIQASETSAGEFNSANGTQAAILTAQQLLALHRFAITEIPCFSSTYLKNETALKLLRTPAIVHAIDENACQEDRTLYKKNTVCNYFIVILEGHVTVQVGDEGMEFDKGPFGYFGHKCLMQSLEPSAHPAAGLPAPSSQNLTNPITTNHNLNQKKDLEDFLPDFNVLAKPRQKLVYVKIERKFYRQYVEKDIVQVQKMNTIQARVDSKKPVHAVLGAKNSGVLQPSLTFGSTKSAGTGSNVAGSAGSMTNFGSIGNTTAINAANIDAKMRAGTGTTTTFNYTPSNLLKDGSRAPSPSRGLNIEAGNVVASNRNSKSPVPLTTTPSGLGLSVENETASVSPGQDRQSRAPLRKLNNKHLINVKGTLEEGTGLLSKSRASSRSEGQLNGSEKRSDNGVKDEVQSECEES